jgi:HSP20 family protein
MTCFAAAFGEAVADWLKDGTFEVLAAMPGSDPKDIDLQITSGELLIRAETTRGSQSDKATVHLSEFSTGQVFRSIRFPEQVDPDSVKAEYKNGMLTVTAPIAKAAIAKKVDIKAA